MIFIADLPISSNTTMANNGHRVESVLEIKTSTSLLDEKPFHIFDSSELFSRSNSQSGLSFVTQVPTEGFTSSDYKFDFIGILDEYTVNIPLPKAKSIFIEAKIKSVTKFTPKPSHL